MYDAQTSLTKHIRHYWTKLTPSISQGPYLASPARAETPHMVRLDRFWRFTIILISMGGKFCLMVPHILGKNSYIGLKCRRVSFCADYKVALALHFALRELTHTQTCVLFALGSLSLKLSVTLLTIRPFYFVLMSWQTTNEPLGKVTAWSCCWCFITTSICVFTNGAL